MRIPIPPVPLPESTATTALSFAAGEQTPAEPRDAATVLLLREPDGGADRNAPPQVYLLRRQASMAFAAGMAVFPGGGVDPRDFDVAVGWAGPSRDEWASRLGCTAETAGALVCAAVRETFEESGVLLAGPDATSVVADTTGADWEADRVALESREVSLTSFLERRGLVLRTDLLVPWAAWLTPAFEPRRYRTWFFVARLPSGQLTRDVSRESSSVVWLDAPTALAQADAGELALMPPTYLNLLDVEQYGALDSVLAQGAGRAVRMFMPELEPVGEQWTLSLPEELRAVLAARRGRSAAHDG